MVTSNSRLAYIDCYDLMDKAIADSKGIKIKFATAGDARYFRIRLHAARRIDREDNAKTYLDGHPMHGRSIYDVLTMRLRTQKEYCWLAIEKLDAREFEIESLSEPREELPLIPPSTTINVPQEEGPMRQVVAEVRSIRGSWRRF